MPMARVSVKANLIGEGLGEQKESATFVELIHYVVN